MVELWRKANTTREISFITLNDVGHVIHEEFPILMTREVNRFLNGEDDQEQIEDENPPVPVGGTRPPNLGNKITSASKELLTKVVGGGKALVTSIKRKKTDSGGSTRE